MNKILHFAFLLFGMTVFAQNLIPGELDPTFQIGTGFEDGMDALAVQPDGKIIVAGQGDTYQGVPFNRIIRLNADGSPDPTFTGMGNLLIYENYNEIALQPDGKILTISHYTNDVNSTTLYYHFKRLNADGSLDTTFNAGGTGVVETPTSWIDNMVVQPDGKIIIGGQFAQYNGVASKNIARLNADGTLDTSFVVGSGFNSSVYSLCLQPDGKVLVSGSFGSYNGSSAYRFTRLNADGTKDTTFTPASTTTVGKMGIQSNGNIVANAAYTINGVDKYGIVILNPNGTVITSNGTLPELTGASNERFLDFVLQPDDKIIAVGYFTQYGGVSIRHILRLTANGFLDNTFNSGFPGAMVQAIAPYPDNRYVISGLFTRYQSQSMNYIARINGLSGIQTPTGNMSQTICGSGTLASLTVAGQGIRWYNAATGGNSLSTATPLVNGTTYYASQTISNNESANRLAVTVTLSTQSTPLFTQIGPICAGDSSHTLPTISTNGITGSWSPAFSTTTTRTYTFTPAAGECATTATMTVTVNNNLTPTFTQIAAICSGANLVLPTTSNNGYSGTWSPAVNNTATTTYGFTPDSGQCARTTSMTVVVNTATVPTFTQVSAICSGANLSALPTTSNNGITGSWSPDLNNLETTTYTFTPSTTGCAAPATMTITVNPTATPTFTHVSAICSGSPLSALPIDSNNGINGSWSPALNNTATTTYTFTPAAGQCAATATMTITVNPNVTPTFTQVSAICSGGTLSALPVDSNNGINGTWSPALNNTATTTYTFTPSAGQCATPATMTITVNPIPETPTITASGATTFCSGGNVVLTSSAATGNIWSNGATTRSITVSNSGGYTVSVSNGNCTSANSAPTTVTVNSSIGPNFSFPTSAFCSGSAVPVLPTTSPNGISGTWTPAIINNLASGSYSFIPDLGQCSLFLVLSITINPLPETPTITASGSANLCTGGSVVLTSSATTGNIWSNGATTQSITVTAAGTYSVASTNGNCTSAPSAATTVTVNPIPETPTITLSGATTFCEGESVILTSSAATGNVWSNGATTPSITVSASGIYSVSVDNGNCTSAPSAEITISVNPTPTLVITNPPAVCAPNTVDITLNAVTAGSTTGGVLTYHTDIASTAPLTNPSAIANSGTYYIKNTIGNCSTIKPVVVTINVAPATPTVTSNGATTFCEGGNVVLTSSAATGNIWSNGATTPSITVSASGIYSVSVENGNCTSAPSAATTVTVNPIPETPTIVSSGTTTFCEGGNVVLTSSAATGNVWSNGATTPSITVSASGTYSVSVDNGNCTSAPSAEITISVNPTPTLVITNPPAVCAPNTVDITLNAVTAGSTAIGVLTYYTDPSSSATPLTNPATIANSGTYYIKNTIGTCSTIKPVVVTINVAPATPTISSSGATTFCEGGNVVLTSSAATGNIWSNGATTPSITVLASGTYSVSVDNGNCDSAPSESIMVEVNEVPLADVTEVLGILTAVQAGAMYQWYDCSGTPILGATGQTYVPVVDGSYKVEISLGTCTVTSACIDATVLGIKGFNAVPEFKYYPNPVVDVLNISYAHPIVKATLFDIAGRTVMIQKANSDATQLNLSGLPAGVYFVEVHAANASAVFRIIRK